MSLPFKIAGVVGVVVVAAAVVAALIVRPDTDAPPGDSLNSIQAQRGTSIELAAVLERSCGECHSNTMTASWYTRVPPFSWILARAASEGRVAVNFSQWTSYDPGQQRALLLASCADAKLGTMPVQAYLLFRSDARLSASDVETICSAAQQGAPTSTTAATPAGSGK